jgi:hypothetical protein
MSNMSYCRFENTRGDFRDCAESLCELLEGDATEALSDTELQAAKDLFNAALQAVELLAEHSGMTLDLRKLAREIPTVLDNANNQVAERKERRGRRG